MKEGEEVPMWRKVSGNGREAQDKRELRVSGAVRALTALPLPS